jgi:opacity protein-like surface antigen
MRLRYLLAIALLLLSAGIQETPAADETTGSLNVTFGLKTLDDDAEPAEDQTVFGARWSFGRNSWPIMFAIDVSTSTGDGSEISPYAYYVPYYGYYYGSLNVDVATTTVSIGIRKEWGKSTTHPFVGGGVEWVKADAKANVAVIGSPFPPLVLLDDDDSDFGYWAEAGILWSLGKHFDLGFNLRYSDAEVALEDVGGFPVDVNVSGLGYGVLLGTRW